MGFAVTVQSLPGFAILLLFFSMALLMAFLARPEWMIPAFIITIPLEVSKLFFPFFLVEKTVDGRPVSVVELWRILLVIGGAGFFVLLLSAPKDRVSLRVSLKHRVTLGALLLLIFCVAQGTLISPDRSRALIETARLASYLVLLVLTAGLLNTTKRIELALKSFLYSVLVLSVLGIYQYFTGSFFWALGLVDWGGTGMNRINVTFGDPNILARFLAISVVVLFVLIDTQLIRKWLGGLAMVAGLLALLFTFSRGGWLLVPVGLAVVWWYSRGGARARLIGRGLIVATLAAVVFFSIAVLQERAETLAAGPVSLGQRVQLIDTGFQMYKDHPVLGVGFGSFGKVAFEGYREFLPYGGRRAPLFLSHTALVTVMAELGTVGLALTFWIFGAAYKSFKQILIAGEEPRKTYALACFVALVLIVLSAQSEGRMFEEPILWVFLGMLIALEKITLRESMLSRRRS